MQKKEKQNKLNINSLDETWNENKTNKQNKSKPKYICEFSVEYNIYTFK